MTYSSHWGDNGQYLPFCRTPRINSQIGIYVGLAIKLRLVVSTSRPIEIEIENVLRVETNFWKPSRFSRRSRSTFFFSRSRFLKSRLFSRDFDASRYLSRSSRQIETVEIFEICRDKSRQIEIYRDISTLSRHYRDFLGTSGSKISTSWEISIEKCDKID